MAAAGLGACACVCTCAAYEAGGRLRGEAELQGKGGRWGSSCFPVPAAAQPHPATAVMLLVQAHARRMQPRVVHCFNCDGRPPACWSSAVPTTWYTHFIPVHPSIPAPMHPSPPPLAACARLVLLLVVQVLVGEVLAVVSTAKPLIFGPAEAPSS